MALGRTDGLDRADVDGPRTGGQRRPLVQPDRQGPSRADPGRRVLSSRGEPRRRRGRPCDRDDVLGPAGDEPEGPQRGPASRPLSTAADPPALDPEAREPGDAAAGDTDASFILHLFATGLGIGRRWSGPSLGPVSLMRPNAGSRCDAWA